MLRLKLAVPCLIMLALNDSPVAKAQKPIEQEYFAGLKLKNEDLVEASYLAAAMINTLKCLDQPAIQQVASTKHVTTCARITKFTPEKKSISVFIYFDKDFNGTVELKETKRPLTLDQAVFGMNASELRSDSLRVEKLPVTKLFDHLSSTEYNKMPLYPPGKENESVNGFFIVENFDKGLPGVKFFTTLRMNEIERVTVDRFVSSIGSNEYSRAINGQ